MAAFTYLQAEEIRDALRRHGVRYLFIGKSGAMQQRRPGPGPDGRRVQGEHAALLQQDGEGGADEEAGEAAIAVPDRFDEDVPASDDQAPGEVVHVHSKLLDF